MNNGVNCVCVCGGGGGGWEGDVCVFACVSMGVRGWMGGWMNGCFLVRVALRCFMFCNVVLHQISSVIVSLYLLADCCCILV